MSRSYIVGVLLGAAIPLVVFFVAVPVFMRVATFLQSRFRMNYVISVLCAVMSIGLISLLVTAIISLLSDQLTSSHTQYLRGFAFGFLLGGVLSFVVGLLGVGPFKRRPTSANGEGSE